VYGLSIVPTSGRGIAVFTVGYVDPVYNERYAGFKFAIVGFKESRIWPVMTTLPYDFDAWIACALRSLPQGKIEVGCFEK
jgi:hypothetical protein